MESLAAAETLPASSRYCTNTVLVPEGPDFSVHVLLVA